MPYATLNDFNFSNKRVIVRVDYNVPLKDGQVANDKRIRATLPTLKFLLDQDARLILMSHLGRPDGKVVDSLRMDPVAKRLQELLKRKVIKMDDCIGPEVEAAAKNLKPGEVMLLENLRFHPEEEENNTEFAKKLASLAEYYVSEAFGTLHRAHASVAAITDYLPSAAGLLVSEELEMLSKLRSPEHPYYAILGGAKVSDKIKLIRSLLDKIDKLFIGGAMMCTFELAKGRAIGKSLVEPDQVELAKKLMKLPKLMLPIDGLLGDITGGNEKALHSELESVPDDLAILDIGAETIASWKAALSDAKTIFWNGPLGLFERDAFSKGTYAIAETLSKTDALVIIGGGDSAAAIEKLGLQHKVTHVSTGGGASLEYVQGKELPGITALEKNFEKHS
ncbi:MAG: phosphoglycerate kinase [Nanoarchaeota archaeon]